MIDIIATRVLGNLPSFASNDVTVPSDENFPKSHFLVSGISCGFLNVFILTASLSSYEKSVTVTLQKRVGETQTHNLKRAFWWAE